MKKRLLAIILCLAVAFSVSACGDGNENGTESTEGTVVNNTVADNVEKPSVISLPKHDDFSTMLTGTYEITEDVINEYYFTIMYDAGLALQEVQDRGVQDGDIVNLDYTGYLNGVAFDNGAATDQWIDVTNNCGVDTSDGSSTGYFIDGFTSGLIGAQKGSTVSYEVTFPEDYGNTDLAGQVTTFEFVIKGIYNELSLDELTDEFVATNMASTYEVSTVNDLIGLCKESVAYYYVMNYLIYNSVVDIPEEYLDARMELYYDYLVEYYGGETTLESTLAQQGYTLETAKVTWLSEIEALVTEEVIFAEIVKQDGLKTDAEWYEDYMSKFTSAYLAYWSSYYPDMTEESVEEMMLKQYGLGDVEAGKNYFMNQKAVRDSIIEKYNAQ